MHILITRPHKQAEALIEKLQKKGLRDIILDPLLDIRHCMEQAENVENALACNPQAIIITSSNGAYGLAQLTQRRDIPVIAVGEASSEAAHQCGFKTVASGGTVKALIAFVCERYSPEAGSLLYISGEVIASDFTPYLQAMGFTLTRVVVYEAKEAQELSAQTLQVLIAREPVSALFYSARTADIFVSLIRKEKLEAGITQCSAFALSAPIAHILAGLHWGNIYSADIPTQNAMLVLLYHHLKLGSYGK